jgi:uncharacterized membrane protein YkvA (DUF1232 family)
VHPARLAAALKPFEVQARQALARPDAIDAILREAGRRGQHSPKLAERLSPLLGLVKAYVRREWMEPEEEEIVLALAAVLYVVSPWDLAPDHMPGGLRDDELMTESVLERLETTIREYDEWRNPLEKRPRRRV